MQDDIVALPNDGTKPAEVIPAVDNPPKKYEFNGRELTADELYEQSHSLNAEMTKTRQEIAETKRRMQDMAKALDPNMKDPLDPSIKSGQESLRQFGVATNEDLDKLRKELDEKNQNTFNLMARAMEVKEYADGVNKDAKDESLKIDTLDLQKYAIEHNLSPQEAYSALRGKEKEAYWLKVNSSFAKTDVDSPQSTVPISEDMQKPDDFSDDDLADPTKLTENLQKLGYKG